MRAKKSLPTEPKLIKWVRTREASISVGASTARGMPKGTVRAAGNFLRSLDLRLFATRVEDTFLRRLDATTEELANALPRRKRQRNWGGARKFLNIYLRGCLYNRYLCDHYRLAIIDPFLEVPLDKSVAIGLRRKAEKNGEQLPRWPGVIHLRAKCSQAYQAFARRAAQSEHYARVHLDLKYWRRDKHEG